MVFDHGTVLLVCFYFTEQQKQKKQELAADNAGKTEEAWFNRQTEITSSSLADFQTRLQTRYSSCDIMGLLCG